MLHVRMTEFWALGDPLSREELYETEILEFATKLSFYKQMPSPFQHAL